MGRVVVTGVGCVTPIGTGFLEFTESLRLSRSGVGALTLCDPTPFQCRVAAEVSDFDANGFMDAREARALPRVARFAVGAARLALDSAGLARWKDPRKVGILLGTSSGSIGYALEQHAIFLERGARRMHPSSPAFGHNSVISSECAIQLGAHGLALTISSACTSGTDAIGIGANMLAAGLGDVLLVGGAEAPITPCLFAAFDRLGMMPRNYNDQPQAAARPFDRDREGLVLGEGAAVLVLERENHARERGARVLAEVGGYSATCDASSHFHQEVSGDDAVRAVHEALAAAGVQPGDVDYVNAHGTGTRENDPFETRVLRRVFGEHGSRILVSSTKSQVGHLLGASGAVEAAVILAGMANDFVPPTLNLEHPDPECELRHVRGGACQAKIDVALSTSFGFGSRNAALVLRRYENGEASGDN